MKAGVRRPDLATEAVVHDLRNLIFLVHANLDAVAAWVKAHAPPEIVAALHDAQLASADSVDLLGQLLSPATGEFDAPAPLAIAPLLDDLRSILARALGDRIDLEIEVRSTARIAFDRRSLCRVLLNLANNARDAMPAGGRLHIAALDLGPKLEIAVTDTGVGMAPDVLASIFDPYFTTKGAAGTGLGLASTAALVRDHGGDISASSQPGRGTTIRILLPALPC